MKDLRGLKVWGKAHTITLAVHKARMDFSPDDSFALRGQIRRPCASIVAHIAEVVRTPFPSVEQ
ncbi:MAG: four helix bundle protein [Desulfobacterales bacterium]|nr:four helix bundle protein [Desulfobacterales bacterium]